MSTPKFRQRVREVTVSYMREEGAKQYNLPHLGVIVTKRITLDEDIFSIVHEAVLAELRMSCHDRDYIRYGSPEEKVGVFPVGL